MIAKEIDLVFVNEFLIYDESSPSCLRWVKDASKRSKKGNVAGCLDTRGYYVLRVGGQLRYAHRVVWLIHNNFINDLDIDHINRNKSDNRISNLRLVSRSINLKNKLGRSKSGVKYLSWREDRQRYDLRCPNLPATSFKVSEFFSKENAYEAAIRYLQSHNALEYTS